MNEFTEWLQRLAGMLGMLGIVAVLFVVFASLAGWAVGLFCAAVVESYRAIVPKKRARGNT